MTLNPKNPDQAALNSPEWLTGLAEKKGKLIVAAVLIAVMSCLWAKVLFGKKTQTVAPVVQSAQTDSTKNQPQIRLSYIELPVMPGRNDVITKDIFSRRNWKTFDWGNKGNTENVEVNSGDDDRQQMHEKNIRQIAQNMTVDAISTDQNGRIQAFIENDVVSAGSKLTVEFSGHVYDFVVNEIKTDKIVLGWKNCSVTLQMSQPQ